MPRLFPPNPWISLPRFQGTTSIWRKVQTPLFFFRCSSWLSPKGGPRWSFPFHGALKTCKHATRYQTPARAEAWFLYDSGLQLQKIFPADIFYIKLWTYSVIV